VAIAQSNEKPKTENRKQKTGKRGGAFAGFESPVPCFLFSILLSL